MTIKLYNMTSEKNKIGKTMTQVGGDITGALRNSTSVTDPVITFELSASDVGSVNYAYITEFNRYYFVNKIVSVVNGLWEITCHVDVLESYADAIKALDVVVDRSTDFSNSLLADNEAVAMQADRRKVLYKFTPSGINFDAPTRVMLLQGGGTLVSST